MTTTTQARESWANMLKELQVECGEIDKDKAGQRAMHRIEALEADVARLGDELNRAKWKLSVVGMV